MGNYAVINLSSAIVENMAVWDGVTEWSPGEGCIAVETDIAQIGWAYVNGEFMAPPAQEVPPPKPAEVLAIQSAKLQGLNTLAEAQKTALTTRIGVLNESIAYEMATPEEIAELPVRTQQRVDWGKYAVLLGRVTDQPGWAAEVQWPTKPAESMDLTVSPVVPETT